MVLWSGSDSFGIGIYLLCCSLRVCTQHAVGAKSVFKLDSLPPFPADLTGVGLSLTMTPLTKSNLRVLFILIVSCLLMTGFWIYFIIAKDPIRP
jgi:hypothetical protein